MRYLTLCLALALTACANTPSQNDYLKSPCACNDQIELFGNEEFKNNPQA